MDKKLLDILACPACKSSLKLLKDEQELLCAPCRLAYPIRDDIPIMLVDEARRLSSDQLDEIR